MAACTAADIVPPSHWEAGCLSLVVDSHVKLLTDLALRFLRVIPPTLIAEASILLPTFALLAYFCSKLLL